METVIIKSKNMRRYFILILIIFAGCINKTDNHKSLKGRWYYFQGNYKEIHANDSLIIFFDFKNYHNQFYQFSYEVRNDSFFTIPVNPEKYATKLEPYFRGIVNDSKQNKFILKKDSMEVTFQKLDDNQEVFEEELLRYAYGLRGKDTVNFTRWAKYHEGYQNRARTFYEDNPEFRYKGGK